MSYKVDNNTDIMGDLYIAHQGGVLDPKCGTKIKIPPLTSIIGAGLRSLGLKLTIFFLSGSREKGVSQEPPDNTWRGKKRIQLHNINIWT